LGDRDHANTKSFKITMKIEGISKISREPRCGIDKNDVKVSRTTRRVAHQSLYSPTINAATRQLRVFIRANLLPSTDRGVFAALSDLVSNRLGRLPV
jgi:Leu/Phe-tRNA-protein transferase